MKQITFFLASVLICFSLSAQNSFSESNQKEQNNPAGMNIPGMNQNAIIATDLEWSDDLKVKTKSGRTYAQHGFIESAGWTGLSSYVIPDNLDLDSIFSGSTDKIDLLYNFNGAYVPSTGSNTLGEWDPWSGYIVKFNDLINFVFSGELNQNKEVNLEVGWNLIPILASCEVYVDSIFAGLDVVIVKQVAGYRLFWPDMSINTLQTLSPGKAYFVLMNSPGAITFPDCMPQQWECGETFVDMRDGKSYATVQIGNQCWMAENLNIGTIVNSSSNQTNNNEIEKYCFDNSEPYCDIYGGLYQWDEMMQYLTIQGVQGICPGGWHLPTDAEWTALTTYLGGESVAGGKMKETGTSHWNSPNYGATNSSGFTALPGGYRFTNGAIFDKGYNGHWWSSSQSDASNAWYRYLSTSYAQVYRFSNNILQGFAVRCLKGISNQPSEPPKNPNPENGSTNQPTNPSLIWSCSDPDGDSLTYDVYFSLDNSPTMMVSTGQADTIYNPGILASETAYYWKIVAHDNQGNITEGPVWNFQTYYCPEPTVYAGSDATICSYESYVLEQATAENHCSLLWTTSGNGYFGDPTALNPEYNPTLMDTVNGSVTLTLTAINCAPCPEITSSNSMTLYLLPGAFSDAGEDQYICDGEAVSLEGVAQNYLEFIWVALNSLGFFGDPFSLSTPFYPSLWDFQAGYTELVLMATSISPCNISAYDTLIVTYLPLPEPDAGPSQFDVPGTTTTLQANQPPVGGYGLWSIVGGTGGSIAQPGNPTSQFSGVAGVSYILSWTLTGPNGCSDSDDTYINFGCYPQPTTANAGPDQLNHAGTSTSLQGNTPVNGTGQWSIITGTGGNIASPANPTSTFTGVAGNSYTLRWTITTVCGSSFDNVTISFANNCPSTVTDVEGNVYNTVQIGSQCWMKQNLKTTKYRNGTSITYPGSNNTTWQNNTTGAYAWYNNNIANKNTYGALYNWYAVANTNNLCPTGWHVPTNAQWTVLTTYLGGESVAAGKMKETGTSHWNSPNTGATNSSGFTALPGGYRDYGGTFYGVGSTGSWWSATEYGTYSAWNRYLYYDFSGVYRSYPNKVDGFSVRCVRD
jgi:uncharacterized protein (TIGR02145 family)